MSTPSFKHFVAASGLIAVLLLILSGMVMIALQSPTGNTVTEARILPTFSQVDSNVHSEVSWLSSDTHQVIISGDQESFKGLTTEVVNGELTIDYNHVDWKSVKDKLEITIKSPNVTAFEITDNSTLALNQVDTDNFRLVADGGSKVTINDLAANNTNITVEDTSTVEISGNSTNLDVAVSGSATYRGDSLVSEVANIDTFGESNASIYAATKRNLNSSQTSTIIVSSLSEAINDD